MLVLDKSHCQLGDRGGNRLEIEPEDRKNCKKLSLRRNYIEKIDPIITDFSSMTWLCLSANALTKIPSEMSELPQLKHLYLCNNKIKIIENLKHCKDLETLELRHNQVEEITGVSHLSKLSQLTFSGNRIEHVSSEDIPHSVRFLGLYGNQITDFKEIVSLVSGLEQLTKLFIGANPFCNDLPLKSTFNISIIMEYQSNGVKRIKCDTNSLGLKEMMDCLKLECSTLKNVDNNLL